MNAMIPQLHPAQRVLFLLPGPYVYEDRCQSYIKGGSFFSWREPVEEMHAAAVLEQAGLQCRIIHAEPAGMPVEKVCRQIRAFSPDLVILSTTFPGHRQDLAWAGRIKAFSPDVLVWARGGQMEFVDRTLLLERFPALDGIVRGEMEFTLPLLLDPAASDLPCGVTMRNGRGVLDTSRPTLENDINGLPLPARSLLDHSLYRSPASGKPMATIVANRGCPHQCTFCAAPAVMGASLRLRDAGSVIREIQECGALYDIRDFFMRGETFTASREWLMDLCQSIRRHAPGVRWVCNARADTLDPEMLHAMKGAGCQGISLGAESANEKTLARIRKGLSFEQVEKAVAACRRAKVMTLVYFMIGFPWETGEDIKNTIASSQRLRCDVAEFFFPYPLPGTGLYESALKDGLISEERPFPKTQLEPVFTPPGLTRKRLLQLRKSARRNPAQNFRAARAALRQAAGPWEAASTGFHGLSIAARALFGK